MTRRRSSILAAFAAAILLPPLLGTGWAGEERRTQFAAGATPAITARRVALDPADPARRRVGGLTFLGGVALASDDPAFGSLSALAVQGTRFLMLSDGGHVVQFSMGADWQPRAIRFGELPTGPRTGWEKRDRDSESLARDPATGTVWVGFESVNAIWRYGTDGSVRHVEPAPMQRWPSNGGPESFTRLADGRFVAIGESPPFGQRLQQGLVWSGDPTLHPAPAFTFRYRPAPGYYPADITQLPDGRLLVLERALFLPFRWANRLMLVDPAALRPGALVPARLLATLAAPLVHDNFEGVAAVREGADTVIWLVSDDNWLPIQTTYLLKFRLDVPAAGTSGTERR